MSFKQNPLRDEVRISNELRSGDFKPSPVTKKPQQKPQRQDSLYKQLKDLIPIANQEGCYDAADYLKIVVEEIERKVIKGDMRAVMMWKDK